MLIGTCSHRTVASTWTLTVLSPTGASGASVRTAARLRYLGAVLKRSVEVKNGGSERGKYRMAESATKAGYRRIKTAVRPRPVKQDLSSRVVKNIKWPVKSKQNFKHAVALKLAKKTTAWCKKYSCMFEIPTCLPPTNLGLPIHSPSTLTQLVSLNLARFFCSTLYANLSWELALAFYVFSHFLLSSAHLTLRVVSSANTSSFRLLQRQFLFYCVNNVLLSRRPDNLNCVIT